MKRIVYACDVGSTKPKTNNFAWVREDLASKLNPIGSQKIEELVDCLRQDIKGNASIALGFESPLFMPVPTDYEQLSCGRDGEGSSSMFAPAGGYVTTLGCQQAAFVLKNIFPDRLSHELTLDAARWTCADKPMLLLWEAFVSGKAHTTNGNDIQDAATAAHDFHINNDQLEASASVDSTHDCFSFIGAAALWSGWTESPSMIRSKCLVLRPEQKYSGVIHPFRSLADIQ